MFAFLLWREFKLSIAEIFAIYPKSKLVAYDKEVLIIEWVSKEELLEKADRLWGTIKIVEIKKDSIVSDGKNYEWKFRYAINSYWAKWKNKKLLNDTKALLKKNWVSSRFVNNDFKNLISAQIIGEKLVQKESDYNYFFLENSVYFWASIWVQDINAYSKRDYSKDRDMQIGMLPPKLSQMMINIWNPENSIFDPFLGLWTILIEASLMWLEYLYWSDLNDRMVEVWEKNLKNFVKENHLDVKEIWIEKLNAKFIDESKFLEKSSLIVTEWYLWEVMTKKNISMDRINKQRQSLKELYIRFFENLSKSKFEWNIVICFPFWEIATKYFYLEDVYEIVNKYCIIESFFPKDFENLSTKIWSLLYKRENQLVGREIFKLKIKKS